MSILGKCILTAIALSVAIAAYCADNRSGPDGLWALGRNDPIRGLIGRPNGTLRRFTKCFFTGELVFLVLLLWLFA